MATRKRADMNRSIGTKKSFTPDPKDFPAAPRKAPARKTRPAEDHKPKRPRPTR